MSGNRPKLRIPLTISDKIIEVLCWSGLIAIWVVAILAYTYLPEIIPIHFNAAGEADGYGGKTFILFFPVIPTVLVIGLSILNRYPHTFNYLEEITPENAERNYRFGTRLARYAKLFLVVLFGGILFLMINSFNKSFNAGQINRYGNVVTIAALLMPVIVLLASFGQLRKRKK